MKRKYSGVATALLLALAAPAYADNSQGPYQPVAPNTVAAPAELVIPNGNGQTAPPSTSLPLATKDTNGGAAGSGISPPSGGSGQLGYLSGIYQSLTAGIGGTVTVNTLSTFNGAGSVTRPANTTAYTGNQLIAHNTTGSVALTQITVTGTNAGTGKITAAFAETSYTGSTAPPTQYWHLFANAAATVSGLADQSAYVGPYAADITNGYYVGTLVCAAWQKTNDSTAQWFSPCASNNSVIGALPFQALAGTTYLYALVETGAGGYTPLSGEVETLLVSTDREK